MFARAVKTLLILLWVSTDQRLPDAGTYVEVQTLDVPLESGWRRYRYVDLSPWAGEPMVYLGWSGQEHSLMNGISTILRFVLWGQILEVSITPQVDPLLVGAPVPATCGDHQSYQCPATNVALDFQFSLREGRLRWYTDRHRIIEGFGADRARSFSRS